MILVVCRDHADQVAGIMEVRKFGVVLAVSWCIVTLIVIADGQEINLPKCKLELISLRRLFNLNTIFLTSFRQIMCFSSDI